MSAQLKAAEKKGKALSENEFKVMYFCDFLILLKCVFFEAEAITTTVHQKIVILMKQSKIFHLKGKEAIKPIPNLRIAAEGFLETCPTLILGFIIARHNNQHSMRLPKYALSLVGYS
ncbi:CLUMA_CG017812, isoform A [Clunio marinus]|uniref:CLUMA_CG017812, isoform A n=1 Tax=Clunio marinus TaxID=568069 RepID=A0A1J1IXC4_9DIPT|nr:CLUMA_CG017812, isoform A [Clunio marinus]